MRSPFLDRRRALLALGAAALAPRAFAADAAPAAAFTDLMPAFWRSYDAMPDAPAAERAARLVKEFFAPNDALYRRSGLKQAVSAEAVARWFLRFDPLADAVRATHARFADGYRANLARLRAALPDFDPTVSPVFLMPSLFRFDGHLEPDGKSLPLFFGPDGIVRYHGMEPDTAVLFAHELFHCYQGQRNPAMALDPHMAVCANLWIEGTATFASERLNPGASLGHVLLDDDAMLRDGPAAAPRIATALLAALDATDAATLESFFDAGWHGDAWPRRGGYYVGYLVAKRLAEGGMSLREMAGLPAPQVRERVAGALHAIADGKA